MPMLKLTGQGPVITLHLEHPIRLDGGAKDYGLALCGFYTDNNISNLSTTANVYFWLTPPATNKQPSDPVKTLTLEPGHYTLETLQKQCRRFIESLGTNLDAKKFTISKAKGGTAVAIVSPLKFALDSTMRWLLGFERPHTATTGNAPTRDDVEDDYTIEKSYFAADKRAVGSKPPNLRALDTIEIQCDLVENSYSNHDLHAHRHQEHRILYTFFPSVPRGYKISETPRERYYAPLDKQLGSIHSVTVSIVDQENRPITNPSSGYIIYLDLKKMK